VSSDAAIDHELLARWRAGDEPAGQALFGRYFDSIYRFFETKCPAEADELVQGTFFACLQARERFRGESSFRTYLFSIARHELYRVLRERQRDAERVDFEVSSIADLVSTPATRIGRSQDRARIVGILRQLPLAHQTLLELYYWEDLDIDALSTIFEAPAVTIRSRLHRARKLLRELIESDASLPRSIADSDASIDLWARDQRD
jgi:RNA polymerase sigma-70 factor (ECF subfamily)